MTPAGPTGDSSRLIPSVSSPTALLDAAGASLDRLVRVQQDFPQPGVLFRDLTPVLADAGALRDVARALAAAAPAAALIAEIGVLAIRKPGKLPGAVLGEDYALEYGTARLELHPDDVPSGSRVLVIEDVLATGGTAAAACRLLQRAGAHIAGVAVAVELTDLGGRSALPGIPVTALRQW